MSAPNVKREHKQPRIQHAPVSGPFYITEFKSIFERYCAEHACKLVPIVQEEQFAQGKNTEFPQLLIAYRGASKEELERISFKNHQINNAIMVSLKKLLINLSLSTLKLEFCNMTSQQVGILADLLVSSNSIIEVSVNGNPNADQNFHVLLKDTGLVNLSLRFCGIDSIGIEKISKELNKPFDSCLLHLNLSSNSICDDGVQYIAKFLRVNRTLVSLNLADNKIYDPGCLILVQPLQKFELVLEEIIVRRRIRFAFLRRGLTFGNASNPGSRSSSKTNSVKSGKDKTPGKHISEHSLGSKFSKKSGSTIGRRDPNHPFVEESYEEDKEIYCKGNKNLLNLNLSYNRITQEGLIALIQMLNYQRLMFANDKGISRISVEGNDFTDCEHELHMLERLLMKKLGLSASSTSTSLGSRNKSQSSIIRKRRSRSSQDY